MHTKRMTTERENTFKTYNRFSILTTESVENSDKTNNVYKEMNTVKNICDDQKTRTIHMPNNRKNKINHTLKVFSTNGAGIIGGKLSSLMAQVKLTNANLVTVQETHARRKGRIQIPDMVVFEAIRKAKGGGTLIASHKSLNPKLIESYEDEFELLVVDIDLKEKKIRVISGYGPQENWPEEKRRPFFVALETEVEKANLAGKSVFIELDANAKLGEKYIAEDPHDISPNGIILAAIVKGNKLL